jgi:diguanylate cyclase (GGDEF)-like protein/putative nucleotidyltransferase with HDIG domain
MRNWEKKRIEDISEHVLVTHIICLLIFLMIAFIHLNLQIEPTTSNIVQISLLMVIFCLFTVLYISRYLLSKIPLLSQARIEEALLLAIVLPLTLAFLWYSGDFVGAKVLIVVPVIIATTAFGKTAGVGAALLASALMFFIDYKIFLHWPADVFQASLIVSSVAVILAWLVGGLMEVERKTQQDLLELADYDQLTGLYNHRYLQEKIALSLQKSVKSGTPLSLVLLDIDQFKYYNTCYGYQKGDQLLAAIGAVLAKSLQEPTYAARYGSDEFMLVFPGKNKTELHPEMDHIKKLINLEAESILPSDKDLLRPFSISIGIAGYPDDTDAALPLIRAAEDDLYRAKYSKGTDYLYQSVLCEINALKIKEAFPALQSLISLINTKDMYTFGHSERVMTYALAMAEKMNLPEDELDRLRYGAALHDIGKIKIETSLLNKPASLNKQEWETMKLHTIWGAQLVETIPAFHEIVPLIRSHHENYDGTGYPDGLQGEEIPLLARILRIADSFDAMTSDRPYQKALSYPEACQELRRKACTYYDPQLINPFLLSVNEAFSKAAQ